MASPPPALSRLQSDFPVHARLTARQREVLSRLLRGWSVAAVSTDLAISVSTSRMHLRHLHGKAGTNNLHALALWAATHSWCCIKERSPSPDAAIIERDKCTGVMDLPEDIAERRLLQRSLQQVTREKRLGEDKLWRMVHYDPLTGLPGRLLVQDRLGQALAAARRNGEKVAVHSVDLDGFRDVTASLGQASGDQLLRLVAQRLGATVREADTVARICANEFMVVQVGARTAEDVARLAERLVAAFDSPFEIDGGQWHVTASCGIALYPDDAHEGDDLHQAAHSAMHAVKAGGRGRFRFFKPEFTEAARDRLEIASQLRTAINDSAIRVVFQPIVRAADGAVVAVEALARFTSPTRGPVAPNVFIPIAESSGMIVPLTYQVQSLALGWLRRWLDDGSDLSLNLNVSSLVFRHEGFEQGLHRSAIEHGIPASRVVLEITESALLEKSAPTTALLERLRTAGYGVAVDDFGTGFSRLASLRSPSLTSLKLDQFFVADLEVDRRSHALVNFAIEVGHDLGLTVIAEGVETEAQYRFLREAGVDECQGYLFARPMSGETVAAFLENGTAYTRSAAPSVLQWRRAS